MEQESRKAGEPALSTLVSDIVRDTEKLIGQQFSLLRSEIGEEVHKAKTAAVALAGGAGLVAAGGMLSTFMAVHLLNRATRLPLWSCYGLVGGLLGAAGVGLLAAGRKEAEDIHLVPETTEALKENVSWLKEQATTR